MKKRLTLATALGAACLAALAGCGGRNEPRPEGRTEAVATLTGLRVAPVAVEEVAVSRELAGSVRAVSVTQVSPRIMAQVLSVAAAEGDRVARGQALVVLDDRDLQARVRQAESGLRQAEAARAQAAAQLDLATATLDRYRPLLEGRAVSRQEFDNVAAQERTARAALAQAESGVTQAGAGLEEARTWLGFAVLAAPVSGRVTSRRVDPGSMAAPGQPLLTIEQEGRYRVEVPVDGTLSGAVGKGTPLVVSVEAAGWTGAVPVTEVVPASDPVSRTFVAKADLPADPRFSSGQYARVAVTTGKRAAVVVPEEAVVRRGQLDGVYAETGGRLAFRIVQAGRAPRPGTREVLSGLAAGERVVVVGADRAVDGAAVAAEAR